MSAMPAKVWDLPVRLFHWALAVLCGFSWWSAEEGGLTLQYHMWAGYSILALVLFRVMWGFAGSASARFTSFLHGPSRVLAALREVWTRSPMTVAGHNPLGGWMVAVMLACLLVQTASGLFANDDILNEGPLYQYAGKALSDTLTSLHHLNFNVLLGLVALHVLAIAWHRVRKGEHLTAAMVHGRKAVTDSPPRLAPAWQALPWLAASAGIVAVIVNL
jgi:cytochrome b